MSRNWIGIVAVTSVLASAPAGHAQTTRPTRDFMRQKLTYTQGIVEGLVTERYSLVVTNATALRNMNLTNAFLKLDSPDYISCIKTFQSKVDGLVKAAKQKDLEKSTERYAEVVNSCVSCHKLFRREQFVHGK